MVKRVDAHPRLKSKAGPYYYTWSAVSAFYRSYLRNPVRLRVETDAGPPSEGVTALAQNSDPFTYFASRPSGSARTSRSTTARSRWACSSVRSSVTCPA